MAGELGSFLRGRRRLFGLTQERVAAEAGISRSHLSQIESGKIGLPNAETRRRLARALAVDHVALLVEAGELREDEVNLERRSHDDELGDIVERLEPQALDDLLTVARYMARQRPGDGGSEPEQPD